MVRSFILNDKQRQAIEDYIENRPNVMTSQIRQLRLRVKKLDYDRMTSDLELLGRLRDLKIPKGRKNKDVAASFTVRKGVEKDAIAASFEARHPADTSGLIDVKNPQAPEEKK